MKKISFNFGHELQRMFNAQNSFLFQSVSLSAWQKLEKHHKKFFGGNFPNCIKILLISSGYSVNSSLANLNEKRIEEIEQYLNSNKYIIRNLECCYSEEYKALDKFQFLPGHKTVILAIPDMLDVSKEHILSDQELKDSLIRKLMVASRRAGLNIPAGTISEANLIQFERTPNENDTVCKCIFSCPFCSKRYTIKHKTFWNTSNAWKHLKTTHIDE